MFFIIALAFFILVFYATYCNSLSSYIVCVMGLGVLLYTSILKIPIIPFKESFVETSSERLVNSFSRLGTVLTASGSDSGSGSGSGSGTVATEEDMILLDVEAFRKYESTKPDLTDQQRRENWMSLQKDFPIDDKDPGFILPFQPYYRDTKLGGQIEQLKDEYPKVLKVVNLLKRVDVQLYNSLRIEKLREKIPVSASASSSSSPMPKDEKHPANLYKDIMGKQRTST